MTKLEQCVRLIRADGEIFPSSHGDLIDRDEALAAASIDLREAEERAYRQGVEDMDEFRRAIVSECNDCVRTKFRGCVNADDFDLLVSRCQTTSCKLHQARIAARAEIRQRLERIGKENGNG